MRPTRTQRIIGGLNRVNGFWKAALGKLTLLFRASLQTSIIPEFTTGDGTPAFARTGERTVVDHNDNIVALGDGEAGFIGTRRVRNVLADNPAYSSEDMTTMDNLFSVTTPSANRIVFGSSTGWANWEIGARNGKLVRQSAKIRSISGSKDAFAFNVGIGYGKVFNITDEWATYSSSSVGNTWSFAGIFHTMAAASEIEIKDFMIEVLEPNSVLCDDYTSEYVSAGVLPDPYHGSGVDGVKNFKTHNANTFDDATNVLTYVTGAAITPNDVPDYARMDLGYFLALNTPQMEVTGPLEIICKVTLDDWLNGDQVLVGKYGTGTKNYLFYIDNDGKFRYYQQSGGGASSTSVTSNLIPPAPGDTRWARCTVNGTTVNFYLSTNGREWYSAGNLVLSGLPTTGGSPPSLEIGSQGGGLSPMKGIMHYAEVRDGIGGPAVAIFDPTIHGNADGDADRAGVVGSPTGYFYNIGSCGIEKPVRSWLDAKGPYGYVGELGTTNLLLHSRNLTSAPWVANAAMAVTRDRPGVDGKANTACRLIATGFAATASQPFTLPTGTLRTFSAYVKRAVGTGIVQLQMENSGPGTTTISTLINSETWTRVSHTMSNENPDLRFLIVSTGDAIDVDFCQFEEGEYASTPTVETTTDPVTRQVENLSYPHTGNIEGAAGTVKIEGFAFWKQAWRDSRLFHDGNASLLYTDGGNVTDRIKSYWNTEGTTNAYEPGTDFSVSPQPMGVDWTIAGDASNTYYGDTVGAASGHVGHTPTGIAVAGRVGSSGNAWGGTARFLEIHNTEGKA